MSQTREVKPGDDEHADLKAYWLRLGQPRTIEKLGEGWQRRAMFPNGGTEPTFTLVVSKPGTETETDNQVLDGLALEMALGQSSLPGRRHVYAKE